MARYANRVSGKQVSLFEDFDPEPRTPLKANATIAEAARLHLQVLSGRAFHYGFDTLCDASNENAELFLQLAGALGCAHGNPGDPWARAGVAGERATGCATRQGG